MATVQNLKVYVGFKLGMDNLKCCILKSKCQLTQASAIVDVPLVP